MKKIKISKYQAASLFWIASLGIILWCMVAFLVYQKTAWAIVCFTAFVCLIRAEYLVSLIIQQEKEKPKLQPGKIYHLAHFYKNEDGAYSAVFEYDEGGKTKTSFFDNVLFLSTPLKEDLGTIFISSSSDKGVMLNKRYH